MVVAFGIEHKFSSFEREKGRDACEGKVKELSHCHGCLCMDKLMHAFTSVETREKGDGVSGASYYFYASPFTFV